MLAVGCEVRFEVDGVGHEGHKPRPFHAIGKHALVFRAGTRFLAGIHLRLHGNESAQKAGVLVVDPLDVILAEMTLLFYFFELVFQFSNRHSSFDGHSLKWYVFNFYFFVII